MDVDNAYGEPARCGVCGETRSGSWSYCPACDHPYPDEDGEDGDDDDDDMDDHDDPTV